MVWQYPSAANPEPVYDRSCITMARILLADDDVELSDMLSDYLGKEGFEVELAHDGNIALARSRDGRG